MFDDLLKILRGPLNTGLKMSKSKQLLINLIFLTRFCFDVNSAMISPRCLNDCYLINFESVDLVTYNNCLNHHL